MIVYLCENSLEGILCGVYDAYKCGEKLSDVKLAIDGEGNFEMFCEYRKAKYSVEKVTSVITAVRRKISEEAYRCITEAALSRDSDKADYIFRFLITGFRYGRRTVNMLHNPEVYNIFRICRYVANEVHSLLGFVRFTCMENNILVSRIRPENDVIVLLAPHFSERLSGENWIIYDEKREKMILHPSNSKWVVMRADTVEWKEKLLQRTDEKEYEELWKCFFESINIAERKNPICQRNHLPMRYRSNMTEFTK